MEREGQLVVMRVGEGRYGVDVQNIREIVKLKSITPIPHSPKFVEGLMNLRGQIVTVINLGQKLGSLIGGSDYNPASASTKKDRVVVMTQAGELIGLHVDAVEEVLRVDNQDMEIPDQGDLKEQGIIDGVFQVKSTLVLKLNKELLLRPLSSEGVEP